MSILAAHVHYIDPPVSISQSTLCGLLEHIQLQHIIPCCSWEMYFHCTGEGGKFIPGMDRPYYTSSLQYKLQQSMPGGVRQWSTDLLVDHVQMV